MLSWVRKDSHCSKAIMRSTNNQGIQLQHVKIRFKFLCCLIGTVLHLFLCSLWTSFRQDHTDHAKRAVCFHFGLQKWLPLPEKSTPPSSTAISWAVLCLISGKGVKQYLSCHSYFPSMQDIIHVFQTSWLTLHTKYYILHSEFV